MKRNTLIITGIAFLVSIVTVSAFAHGPGWSRGQGYGNMMGPDCWGSGWHHKGWYGYSQEGYYGNLSAEEIAKLDQQRSEFFKATENIRQKIYEKEFALRSELAKENLDADKASKLQNEISKLQSNLDQERLNYEIMVKKSIPNYNHGRGKYCPMMGYSPHGGGCCSR
jgi:Spy/CpxP family protein refolding chaperone